jgi:tryptophan synthase alpha chain
MSERLRATFDSLHAKGRTALIPFIMAGDPSAEATAAILDALPAAGADIIELGIPFSDPMADGPAIQAAGQRALAGGMTLRGVLSLAQSFRKKHPEVPLVLMGYYNPILQMGLDVFAENAHLSGVDGVIVVDLPPEEQEELHALLQAKHISFIRLIAPTTGEARLQRLLEDADGFVYTIAVKGITGAGSSTAQALESRIAQIRVHTRLPVVAGFGIKTPEQAAALKGIADGVVIGSALVDTVHARGAASPEEAAEIAGLFMQGIAVALK